MNIYRQILTFLLPSIFFLACQNKESARNIEEYYFPLKDLKEGKVYEYRSVGNANDPPMYWHYQSVKENGSQYLLSTAYGPELSPDQSAKEERVDNGMLLVEYFTYEADPTGAKRKTKASIEAANVFPFEVKKTAGVLLTSIRWQPTDSTSISFVRNRQYDRDTTFIFKGKTLPAVKFNLRELVDQEQVGHLELEYEASEIYAEGIGLVYFKKDINERWQMAYQLAEIYSEKEFEEKFKIRLEQ